MSVSMFSFYINLFALGALDAFLSVSLGIQRIKIERGLTRREQIYTGAVRTIIGVIGALVIGLAIESKFITSSFGSPVSPPVFYLLALLAGFSESFVPNTLRRAEAAADRQTQENE